MYPGKKTSNSDNYKDGDTTAYYGYLPLFQLREISIVTDISIISMIPKTHLILTSETIAYTSTNGHLKIVKWLSKNTTLSCVPSAIEWAAEQGHLEVIKFLAYNMRGSYTREAIEIVCINGHLEVVMF